METHTPSSFSSFPSTDQNPPPIASSPLPRLSSLGSGSCLRDVSRVLCPAHPHASPTGWVRPSLANTQPALHAPRGLELADMHTCTHTNTRAHAGLPGRLLRQLHSPVICTTSAEVEREVKNSCSCPNPASVNALDICCRSWNVSTGGCGGLSF